MDQLTKEQSHDLKVLVRILRLLIYSYAIGWIILIANIGSIPLFDGLFWEIGATICLGMTLWLAHKLSMTALHWWVAYLIIYVSMRAFAYGYRGIFNPLGVWLLVLTGVSITALAVISVNALAGRLESDERN